MAYRITVVSNITGRPTTMKFKSHKAADDFWIALPMKYYLFAVLFSEIENKVLRSAVMPTGVGPQAVYSVDALGDLEEMN